MSFEEALGYHSNACGRRGRKDICELHHKKGSQHCGTADNTEQIPDPTQKMRNTESWH